MMGPNLFLVAAPRSGSTQLARWLTTHPEIALAPVKEPNFFSAHEFPAEFVRRRHLDDVDPRTYCRQRADRPAQFAVFRRFEDYARLFAGDAARWRIDASTSYLACPDAPGAIAAFAPSARIILLTREPVARALSHYALALRTGQTRASLGWELAAERSGLTPLAGRFLVRPSVYAPGLARFRRAFPDHQRLELRFEEVTGNPVAALGRIAEFLNVDATGFDLSVLARNAGVLPRFPALNRLIQATGVKSVLRAALSAELKARIKPMWFGTGRPRVSPAEIAALAALIAHPERCLQ